MSVKMRIKVEKEIVGRFVKDALAKGYSLSVSLERGYDIEEMLLGSSDYDKIMEEVFSGDECHIFVHDQSEPLLIHEEDEYPEVNCVGWVYCIYGNHGWDVISDYTVNLEELLTNAKKISEEYA